MSKTPSSSASSALARATVHETAVVEEGASLGDGTRVWHHAQVRVGARVGNDCIIGKGVYVGAGVEIGANCKIQNYALVFEGAHVEDAVFIGPAAVLANDRYPRAVTPDGDLKTGDDWELGRVYVEHGASIGAGAIVVPDARIGAWALVGSGSVVTRDVRAHELVAGNPARHVGFVCSCGHRLAERGGSWACTSCDRTFDLT